MVQQTGGLDGAEIPSTDQERKPWKAPALTVSSIAAVTQTAANENTDATNNLDS